MKNAAAIPCVGAIPFIARKPEEVKLPEDGFYYLGNGAFDYNRYHSARVVAELGNQATHRLYPGGHTITGWEPAEDGLLWVYARHLYNNAEEKAAEVKGFESRLLPWLIALSESKPQKAYYWADFLLNVCQLEGDRLTEFDGILQKLDENPAALAYFDGRLALAKFSKRYLAPIQEEVVRGHTTEDIQRAANRYKEQFASSPEIAAIFEDLAKKTE